MEESKTTPLIIIVLALLAFLTGSLWTRVNYLEKGKKQEEKTAQPSPQGGEDLENPQVLGAEDQAAIVKDAASVKGAVDAKVTIVEFSEYQCPFCQKYFSESYGKLMEKYGDKIRYVFRDFPLPMHQHAQKTAEASRCAGEQGKYWQFHDKLFSNQDKWVNQQDITATLLGFAQEIGLNQEQFKSSLSSGKFTQAIKDDIALAQKVGVSGTPSFFINGIKLVGSQPYEVFEKVIEEELAK